MDVELRTITDGDREAFEATLLTAFGEGRTHKLPPERERLLETSRCLAAFEGESIVGTAADFAFDITVPGGSLPAAGVTWVGVLPTHRRRGILARLATEQLLRAHEREEPLAVLWASESSIYERFGYGVAMHVVECAIERAHAKLRAPVPAGEYRLVDVDEAVKVFPDVYDTVRGTRPGMYARTEQWWRWHTLYDPESWRDGSGPTFRVVWERDGRAEAYATYRVKQRWEKSLPQNKLEVLEVMAASHEATAAIWQYLFGVDLVKKITIWALAADDPLPLLLEESRRLVPVVHDGLWARVVDVKAALGGRRYAAAQQVTFALQDPVCPWNDGVWTLASEDGEGHAERSGEEPELLFSATELGAVYLGGVGFHRLHRAGRVTELARGAVARADALFATDISPWCPELF